MRRPKSYLLVLFLITILCIPSVSFAKEKLAVMELKAKGDAKKSIAEALSVEVRNAIHNQGKYYDFIEPAKMGDNSTNRKSSQIYDTVIVS